MARILSPADVNSEGPGARHLRRGGTARPDLDQNRLCVISDGGKADPRPESTRNLRSRRLRWRRATLAGSLALAGWPCQCRSLSSTLNRLGYKWRAGSHWHGDSGHPSRCNDRVPIVGRCLPPVICIIIVSRRLPSESASPGSSRHDHAGWAAAARL